MARVYHPVTVPSTYIHCESRVQSPKKYTAWLNVVAMGDRLLALGSSYIF